MAQNRKLAEGKGKVTSKARRKRQPGVAPRGNKRVREVVFDEEARREWLTGFHKRKQERRKHGLTMQALKDRQKLVDARKERREALRDAYGFDPEQDEAKNNKDREALEEVEEVEQTQHSEAQVLNFDDNTTLNMFGGTVTVVTGDGIDVDDEDAQEHFSEEHAPEVPHAIRAKKAEMSRKASLMASAIKLASLKLGRKRKRNLRNPFREKAEAKDLVMKAMGRPLKNSKRKNKRRKT